MKRFIVLTCCTLFAAAAAMPAAAHVDRTVGRFETSVGWIDEPTYAGFRNGVHIDIRRAGEIGSHEEGDDHSEGEHAEATPVTNARLEVEVIFGDENGTERVGPLPVEPAAGQPGVYQAPLIPTRPGVYTFHFTGTIGSSKFDEVYTAADDTFAIVEQPSEIEFPAKDPSREQLAQRISTVSEDASEVGTVRTLAIVGIVMAAAAIGLALGARKGRA